MRFFFAKKASFKRYGITCISRQRVHPYLVFVTTQASLLVKTANEILRNTSMRPQVSSFLTSCIYTQVFHVTAHGQQVTPPHMHSSVLHVCGNERRGFAFQCFFVVHARTGALELREKIGGRSILKNERGFIVHY